MSALSEKGLNKEHDRCTICKIKSYSFCRCLQDEQLKVFSGITAEKEFKDKQSIFLQQEHSKHLYNITKGNIKIYKLLNDGRIQIIGFLYPGDFFGSYKKGRFNYSAEAIGDVRLCVFKQEVLDIYLEKNMNLAKELLHMTSHELTLAQDRIGVLGKMNANERMAKFILPKTPIRSCAKVSSCEVLCNNSLARFIFFSKYVSKISCLNTQSLTSPIASAE